ncbi:3-oxoacyl-ACP reductase [Denitratisoma sp. DHT3]|uniref:SDR family NAD(P)-dependent oxidoreductase n=1 Tax=Denitratisoma sp. DHT3 TaxID=1981880 RepID=UPI0011987108|nr:SDR family oxidoreductase [Denitratisoma sp. DHT3]QDX80532.1 3-oxoacyl-ACP reductase [Denitratisoma sp. DHT3]
MDYQPKLNSPHSGVVVTGSASGLGLASAEALAAVGRPVALWDINGARAVEAAATLAERYGVATLGVGIDLRDADAIAPALAQSRAALPDLGGLVHAAGVLDTGSLDGITPQSWEDGINVHLRPLALITQAMLPDLRARPGGAIVAFSSINATLGNGANPVYSAAKGGVLSLVRSLADRLALEGIRINAISPGQIYTPMLQPVVDVLTPAYFERRILLGRIGVPAEIGRAVRFLMSDEASYITATELVVDGGNISSQR